MNTSENKISSILATRYLELREELRNATLDGNLADAANAIAAINEIVETYAAVNDMEHRGAEAELFDYAFVNGLSEVTLKPCPFCGKEPMLHTAQAARDAVSISCFNCASVFIVRPTREAAAKAWNMRYDDTEGEEQ